MPEDAEVHVVGTGIIGGFEHGEQCGRSGRARIIITGLAFWGGVEVKRKSKKNELKRRDCSGQPGGRQDG